MRVRTSLFACFISGVLAAAPVWAGNNTHGAAPVSPARPGVRAAPGYRGGYRGYGYRGWGGSYYRGYSWGLRYPAYGWGWGYYGAPYRPYVYGPVVGSAAYYASQPPAEPALLITAGAQGQFLQGGGGAVGLNASIEGERLGVMVDVNNFILPNADGSFDVAALRTLEAHGTFAVLAGPMGRLRLEAGVDSVFAPNVILIGPGVGASGTLSLVGPLGADASLRLTPWPYRQLDGMAGLTLALGPLGLRGGFRVTVLDDEGHIDGTEQTNVYAGPYVGLTLSI
jgi:hypothetical protein